MQPAWSMGCMQPLRCHQGARHGLYCKPLALACRRLATLTLLLPAPAAALVSPPQTLPRHMQGVHAEVVVAPLPFFEFLCFLEAVVEVERQGTGVVLGYIQPHHARPRPLCDFFHTIQQLPPNTLPPVLIVHSNVVDGDDDIRGQPPRSLQQVLDLLHIPLHSATATHSTATVIFGALSSSRRAACCLPCCCLPGCRCACCCPFCVRTCFPCCRLGL
mmetsp:Transcript_6411/g.14259  ORF Transcript_6411/g.14259 Transcript_6411/m.14259 type:complete len:217 (-) Transcript_6411:239-889(-)